MEGSRPQRTLATLVLVGTLYLVVNLASAKLAETAGSGPMQVFWRRSAFILCGLVFLAHIAYEQLRLRNATRSTAWHAAVAVALGALGLAVLANIHELQSASGFRPRMLVALVAWPLLTAVPAFIVALVLAPRLGLTRSRG